MAGRRRPCDARPAVGRFLEYLPRRSD
jgi:hypothetical protein